MITLIDKYGFVKQLSIVLPFGSQVYRMACLSKDRMSFVETNAAFAPQFETRSFHRQGNTDVFQEA